MQPMIKKNIVLYTQYPYMKSFGAYDLSNKRKAQTSEIRYIERG